MCGFQALWKSSVQRNNPTCWVLSSKILLCFTAVYVVSEKTAKSSANATQFNLRFHSLDSFRLALFMLYSVVIYSKNKMKFTDYVVRYHYIKVYNWSRSALSAYRSTVTTVHTGLRCKREHFHTLFEQRKSQSIKSLSIPDSIEWFLGQWIWRHRFRNFINCASSARYHRFYFTRRKDLQLLPDGLLQFPYLHVLIILLTLTPLSALPRCYTDTYSGNFIELQI